MSPHLTDDELRALIGAALDPTDPVPPELTLAARSAIAWRDMDAGIAELLFDSSEAETATSGVRSGGGPRLLSFGSADLSVELQVETQPVGRRLMGQITPPLAAAITVRHPGGAIVASADATGAFVVDGVPPGPISILVQPNEGPPTVTDWIAS